MKSFYIPFDKHTAIGGPTSFMKNLKRYLDNTKYLYDSSDKNGSSIFYVAGYNPLTLFKKLIFRGKKIQRLDGMYYFSRHGFKGIKSNIKILLSYIMADHVVFQSEYSKRQYFKYFYKLKEKNYTLILNGADHSIFHPSNEDVKKEVLTVVTTGSFRNIDNIRPLVEALDKIKNQYSFEFKLVGPIHIKEIEDYLDSYDFIVKTGPKTMQETAEILRESDVFAYSILNPNCPNSVIESICSGIPVVGFDTGAMKEVCYFASELLVETPDKLFHNEQDLSCDGLSEKFKLVFNNLEAYKKKFRQKSPEFSLENMGQKYINVFNRVLKNG